MTRLIRRLLAVAIIALAPTLANAQTAPLNGLVSTGTPPTGFTVQQLQFNCNNAVPASGQCWPYLQIYDGTTKATVNTNGGANVNILGTLPPYAVNPTIANTAFGISGTLPAYAAIPAFKVDQTTPGTTNLVQIGGTLPAFAANPTMKIDQTTPGTTNGVVVNNTLSALVTNADNVAPVTAVTATAGASPVNAYGFIFDGANWDRMRGTSGGFPLVNPGAPASWGVGATGAAVPANAQYTGAVSSGNLTAVIQADNSAPISVATATTTQLVALSAGKKIYVTSFDVIAGGTGNITFEYGTGTNCATGTTTLTGAYNLTAQAGMSKGSGLGPVLVVASGNALCILTSAAVQMSGSVSYTQF